MMAEEDRESKTEEPSERKLRDEIERGNVPFSREAANFASVSAMLIIGGFVAKDAIAKTSFALAKLLGDCGGWPLQNGFDAVALLDAIGGEMFRHVMPTLLIMIVAGLLAYLSQSAPRFVLDRIQPDLQRISVANGWHRIFGGRGQAELLKGVFKLISIGLVIWAVFRGQRDNLMNAMAVEPEAIPELVLTIAMKLLSAVCLVTLLLFVADFLWTRVHWRRDLRMSKQEIKDELKQNESDPLMKSRLRSLVLDRLRKSMIAAVPKATLVIANPTHYAIALRYVKEEGGAPLVLSKGKDLIALKIREIAEQHSIPIVEDKALARSLYDSAEVNRSIPPEFFKAVAEIIHFLYQKDPRRNLVK